MCNLPALAEIFIWRWLLQGYFYEPKCKHHQSIPAPNLCPCQESNPGPSGYKMSVLVSRPKEKLPVRSTTKTNLYFVTLTPSSPKTRPSVYTQYPKCGSPGVLIPRDHRCHQICHGLKCKTSLKHTSAK